MQIWWGGSERFTLTHEAEEVDVPSCFTRHNHAAIWRYRDGGLSTLAGKACKYQAGLQIPDLDRIVVRSGHRTLTVRCDCHSASRLVCPLSVLSACPIARSQTVSVLSPMRSPHAGRPA